MSLCSIEFLFNNNTLFSNNEKNKNIYDDDNNIKPIEVNSDNNEYIIFLSLCATFMMTIIVHIPRNKNIFFVCRKCGDGIFILSYIMVRAKFTKDDSTRLLLLSSIHEEMIYF